MGRLKKTGLDYFSFDTGISNDPKIELLEATFPIIGFYTYIKLLSFAYGDKGYYLQLSDKQLTLIASKLKIDKSKLSEIIEFCVDDDVNLFDKSLFTEYNILTSRSIQERFLMSIKNREQAKLTKEYLLIRLEKRLLLARETVVISVNGNIVNSYGYKEEIIPKNNLRKKSLKERKVKESKGKEITKEKLSEENNSQEKIYLEILDLWNLLAIQYKLTQLRSLTTERKILLQGRLREKNFDFKKIMEIVKKSPYLLGKVTDFRVSFDWIIKNDANYIKILEGNYLDRNSPPEPVTRPKFEPLQYLQNGVLKPYLGKIRVGNKDPVRAFEELMPADKATLNKITLDVETKNKLELNATEKYILKIEILKILNPL